MPPKIRVCRGNSECFRVDGVCYLLGSVAGFVSIGSTMYSIAVSANNIGNLLTTSFLMLSYLLKLGYYRDKALAFMINASLGGLWGVAVVYAIGRMLTV